MNFLRCKAGASHRFKSLPAIPGEVPAFRKTGYLMNAGHFRKNTVSTGDLNRPRSPEVRKPLVYFWFFSYTRKARKTFLSQVAPRFCKPRISTPQRQLPTATIKTFYKGRFEVLQTSNQRTQTTNSCNPMKSFFRLAAVSLRDGTRRVLFRRPRRLFFSALRRCPCREFFLLFVKYKKKGKKTPLSGSFSPASVAQTI